MVKDKIVIVTGGNRGIGKAIVETMAEHGAIVYSFDKFIPEDTTTLFDAKYTNQIHVVEADVTSFDSISASINEIVKKEGRVDVLVNNAGITKDNLIMRMSEEEWDAVLNINLKGAFVTSKAIVRTMMSQRSGRIINIGSIVGTIGNAGQVNYSASKAGLIGMTKSLARELASRNILVNLVAPGYVNTPMTQKLTDEQREYFVKNIPLKRVAEPEEIADVVLFLSSKYSNYITGEVIHVNGGLSM